MLLLEVDLENSTTRCGYLSQYLELYALLLCSETSESFANNWRAIPLGLALLPGYQSGRTWLEMH